MADFWTAFWFFLPAGLANMCPILATRIPIVKDFITPIDFNKSFRGKRIFGNNKTWRGLIFGVLVAGITGLLIKTLAFEHITWPTGLAQPSLGLGLLLGFGALAGDTLESFFKRQVNIKPGAGWFPFDQIDYIIGGLVVTAPISHLTLEVVSWVFIVYFGLHLVFSYLGYLLGLKDKPI